MQRCIKALSEAGYEITWISRYSKFDSVNRDYKEVFIKTFFNSGALFYLEFNLRLLYALYRNVSSLFVAVDVDTLFGAYVFHKMTAKDYLFDAHEYFSEVPELNGKTFKKWIWKRLAKKAVPQAVKRYTVGEELAKILANDYQCEFSVVRNIGNYAQSGQGTQMGNSFQLVYLGVLNKGRGVESLINCLAFLPDRYKVLLIGEGDLSEKLRRHVKSKAYTDRVVFKGMVKPERLYGLLAKARIGINLLEASSLSYYYSLANKHFDYLHANLPMIGMDFPEYRRMNELYETSILVNSLDPKILAEAILKLEDVELYQSLKTNCQLASKEYNWQLEKRNLIELFKGLTA